MARSGNVDDAELLLQASEENTGQVIKKAFRQQMPVSDPEVVQKTITPPAPTETVLDSDVIQQTVSTLAQQIKKAAIDEANQQNQSESDAISRLPRKEESIARESIDYSQQIKNAALEEAKNQSASDGDKTAYAGGESSATILESISIIETPAVVKIVDNSKYKTLQQYEVYDIDTDANSKYFKISEFPDVLTSGRNFFLIDGTEFLQPFTEVKFEVIDSKGNVIYSEISDTLINGTSRMVTMYVYDGITNLGSATVTLLGVLSNVPKEWKDSFNVKWQRSVKVNTLMGDTKPPILIGTPEVSTDEYYDVNRTDSISKITYTYTIET